MGNENQFNTKEECDAGCTDYIDPRSGSNSNQTPENSQCFEEPFVMGRCRAALKKWSWNPDTLSCEEFTYGGCEANGNNFRSEKKCNKVCGDLAIVARNFQNDVLNIADEEEEEEEEQEETQEQRAERICNLPSEQGPCRARFDRFYYDNSLNKCKKFTFGGCEGNENNFVSKQECADLCVHYMLNDAMPEEEEEEEEEGEEQEEPVEQDEVCTQKIVPGFCRGYFPRWAWDGEKCTEFVWGGCGGNENKFDSESACNERCGIQARNMLFDVFDGSDDEENEDSNSNLLTDLVDPCSLSIQRGPCRALYLKYAFDGEQCIQFQYGGCMGNANNFGTLSDCRSACMMQHDAGVESDEEEEDGVDETSGPVSVFPQCTTTGSGSFKSINYASKMECTSLGNSHHSGDPATEYLRIDGVTDSPTFERVAEFVERFPSLKILVLNGLSVDTELNIKLPSSLKVFISRECGWTAVSTKTFLRAGQLKHLDLSDNNIVKFTNNQFRGQKALATVDFSNNKLGGIPQGLFESSKRTFCDLTLDGNDINGIHFKTFVGYRKLKKLSLKKNPLEQGLPDNLFSQNPQLKCILLNGSKITSLNKNTFSAKNNSKLKQIDLSDTEVKKNLRKNWEGKGKVWKQLMKKL